MLNQNANALTENNNNIFFIKLKFEFQAKLLIRPLPPSPTRKNDLDSCLVLLLPYHWLIWLTFAQENVNRRIQEEKNQMLAKKLEKEKDSPDTKRRVRKVPAASKDDDVCIVDLVLQDIKRGSFNLRSVKSQNEKHI